uniref:Glutaredoxin domain-containing protein n=1 Tax=Ascaris lumbricoides TaxID=6252 RepID=A0A9J2PSC1_ASCLU
MATMRVLQSKKDFEEFTSDDSVSVVHFAAKWVDVCARLDSILGELHDELKSFKCARIEAEQVPEVSLEFSIQAAPTLLLFKAGKEVDRINGFNPGGIKAAILKHSAGHRVCATAKKTAVSKEALNERLRALINKSRLVIFMKGTPEQPRCGFSRQAVELLRSIHADFSSFDILNDEEVRQGLKEYSNWPTYPQIYLDGELLGGLDVLREELADEKFADKLPKITA